MKVTPEVKLLRIVSLVGVLLVITALLSPTRMVTATQIKYNVCHVTNVPAEGYGVVITIADPAWDAHEAHGDKMIGEWAVEDGDGKCHLVTVTLEAVDDEVPTPVDTPVTINVLANDSYVAPVVVSLQVGPSHGLVSPWVDGTITYYPDSGFIGMDSFTYQICDTGGQCDTATVTIIVGP